MCSIKCGHNSLLKLASNRAGQPACTLALASHIKIHPLPGPGGHGHGHLMPLRGWGESAHYPSPKSNIPGDRKIKEIVPFPGNV